MIVSVTGSRTISDYNWFANKLEESLKDYKVTKFISGGARGVDTLIKIYCNRNNKELEEILPDWDKYGKKAGFVRNKEIIDKSDFNLIFWDGKSKGSKFNIDYCEKNNKKFKVIRYDLQKNF